jgi:hypothetical protein
MNEININSNIVYYNIIKDLCRKWLIIEKQLSYTTKDLPEGKAWEHIADSSLFDLEGFAQLINDLPNNDTKIVTRLSRLYISISYTIGTDKIKKMDKELNTVLKEFGIKNYNRYKKQYPFINLIPFLNECMLEINNN